MSRDFDYGVFMLSENDVALSQNASSTASEQTTTVEQTVAARQLSAAEHTAAFEDAAAEHHADPMSAAARQDLANHPADLIFPVPVFQKKIWGGRKLHDDWGYAIPDGPIGECWAISAHPHGDCLIATGSFEGLHLSELWDQHREVFDNMAGDRFPLLIKIIDAAENLSVQVHPDDAYAAIHENGSLGKRECWYVLDVSAKKPQIIVGQHAKSADEFRQMVAEGKWEQLLNTRECRRGDFFMIEPGTVHAILHDTLILETQQSSDITYRVYDYNRVQEDGTLRDLHLDKSLDVINYELKPRSLHRPLLPHAVATDAHEKDIRTADENSAEVAGENNRDGTGEANREAAGETNAESSAATHATTPLMRTQLGACQNFEVERISVCSKQPTELLQTHPFMCLSVIEGTGCIQVVTDDNTKLLPHELVRGTHMLAPSSAQKLLCSGDMTLICSYVPEHA